jgi:transcriptional regulator with XRE-family HTH domain
MGTAEQLTTLPERLRWALDHAGHTQASLARDIGISKGAIGQWMSGDTEHIRPAYLFDSARALRVEPEWLATGNGPRTRLERQAPDVDAEICRLVSALPPNGRTALLALLAAIMQR